MFANITVAEAVVAILATVAALVAFLKGIEYLWKKAVGIVHGWFSEGLEEGFKPVNQKLTELTNDTQQLRLSVCKNYIVRFLADLEQGQEVDEVERQRFYENYDLYISLGGNSYLKDKVERMRKEKKL